ncbi:MAG: ParB N-terminal domain-containing protein [Rhodobacterales bacterium]|nr:ParB N-terminal domain-containing protein [Rhodobacterales bacterium]
MTEKRTITMEDLAIQAWDVERPLPAENNHKKHTQESVAKLAKSMADIGQIQPIVVDKEGEIIAGHGRLMAAKALGWSKIKVIQVPVDRATAIKARIADNLMSNQNIDQEKMLAELRELEDILGGDVDLTGMIADDKHAEMIGGMLAEDLEINLDAMSDDISADVEEFSEEGEAKMAAADETDVPLRRVFGFQSVTPRQARVLSALMSQIVEETGISDPADAFSVWAEELIG